MKSSPLISVAMATYNGSKFIEEQLDSILNQTYKNIEIIIVDDCSTDNTVEILSKYKLKHPCIRVFRNELNINVNQTFNGALGLCNGEFIAISDQDDIWLPNKLEDSFDLLKNNVLVYSNSELVGVNGVKLNRRKIRRKQLHSGSESRIFTMTNRTAGHTFLFKSELLRYILPIPRYSHYDWWIAFVATNFGSIIFSDQAFVLHRIHQNNQTKTMKIYSDEEGLFCLQKWIESILSLKILKNKMFYEELYSILKIENLSIKKFKLFVIQMKYRNLLFDSQGVFSKINKARKLNLPHIAH